MSTWNQNVQVKWIIGIFIIAGILSFIYVIINGYYNGDFIKKDVTLSCFVLSCIFILTILPFVFLYFVYKRYTRKKTSFEKYNINIIRNVAWALLILQILLRFSGYGTMGSESMVMTSSPLLILRAFAYKLPAIPFAIIYIFGSKYKRGILITIGFLILLSIINKSLGGLFMAAIILIFKYPSIITFFRFHILITCIVLFSLPTIINSAYNLRNQLRDGPGMAENNFTDLFFGKVCGRISSFSNNAYIFQCLPALYIYKDEVPNTFYVMDMFHFFGIRPSEFKSTGNFVEMQVKHGKDDRYSSMAGIGGVLFISLLKSPEILMLNLFVILVSIYLIFWIAKRMRLKNAAEVAFLLSIWFTSNGDISEITTNIYSLIFIWIIIKLLATKNYAIKH